MQNSRVSRLATVALVVIAVGVVFLAITVAGRADEATPVRPEPGTQAAGPSTSAPTNSYVPGRQLTAGERAADQAIIDELKESGLAAPEFVPGAENPYAATGPGQQVTDPPAVGATPPPMGSDGAANEPAPVTTGDCSAAVGQLIAQMDARLDAPTTEEPIAGALAELSTWCSPEVVSYYRNVVQEWNR